MLNMDFAKRVCIDTLAMDWQASPMPGVWRKPLAREGAEQGHATSIVRYEAGASFRAHNHPGGEEILVLSGTFSDESGDFGAGTYFRNPQGFIHAPFSREGCVILVKLHQFQADDRARICIDTTQGQWQNQGGLLIMPLHNHGQERVSMVQWRAEVEWHRHEHPGGEELYILSGELRDEYGCYPAGTWIRYPPGSEHYAMAAQDTLLWMKCGHLN